MIKHIEVQMDKADEDRKRPKGDHTRKVLGKGLNSVLGDSDLDGIKSSLTEERSLTDDIIKDPKRIKVDWSKEKSVPIHEVRRKEKKRKK